MDLERRRKGSAKIWGLTELGMCVILFYQDNFGLAEKQNQKIILDNIFEDIIFGIFEF